MKKKQELADDVNDYCALLILLCSYVQTPFTQRVIRVLAKKIDVVTRHRPVQPHKHAHIHTTDKRTCIQQETTTMLPCTFASRFAHKRYPGVNNTPSMLLQPLLNPLYFITFFFFFAFKIRQLILYRITVHSHSWNTKDKLLDFV